ncbi:MAG: cysteine desulfurase family protein [Candidatus Woesearchaeota archaeon]
MIYLDNAATTKMLDLVKKEYIEKLDNFFNPSSQYRPAVELKKDIDKQREIILKKINAKQGKLIFTSSATESNNMFVKTVIDDKYDKINIVSTKIEHSSINNELKFFENKGVDVRYLDVLKDGSVDLDSLHKKIDKNTKIVCISHVNNEIGTINDIEKISKTIKQINPKTYILVDGVQAVGKIPVDLSKYKIDGYSFCSHKIHGPKGIAALYLSNRINSNTIMQGGKQELELRPGTENYAAIKAFSKAVTYSVDNLEKHYQKTKKLKNIFIDNIKQNLLNFNIIQSEKISPYICNLNIKNIKSEVLVRMLGDQQIYINTGSSCSTKSKNKNRVIKEVLDLDKKYLEGTIRISFGLLNTEQEIQSASESIIQNIKKLRLIVNNRG